MISTAILDLLILCGLASAQLAQNISPPIVDLGYAKYEGVFNGTTNVTSFLGMRFAAAPIGELRWQAPQLPTDENENGIQKAVTQPLQCPQAAPGTADRNPYRVNTTSPSHGLMKR
ncbi:hypothetical protein E1B28_006573 [Marasmius oreades]|uniref:Carboxylesterase type B domain-containing protein n=1 Tax=Marasmius oreades TaxID=181124 RepID=A0A9P7UWF1_9AGAR|nr:uncharacterized protein E1B28_006573 [Marasmius oreades]KAG7095884.1 hypothetical protein E1B28_006573 [Marasmius oreades]